MVFQSYAIWPHMTVAENVAYPLRAAKVARAERKARVDEALDVVGLGGLGERPAPSLSGGQQQRVALARAIVGKPRVLLLDEPLSNLDAKLRDEMRAELRRLQTELGLTAVYVTHDQAEALSLSDWVAVMNKGLLLELGKPEQIYLAPKTRFTAEFIGKANFLDGTIASTGAGIAIDTPDGRIPVAASTYQPGEAATVFFRPENVRRALPDEAGISATITQVMFLGEIVECQMRTKTSNKLLEARFGVHNRPVVGDEFTVAVDADKALILDDRPA
jgi:ABC-type Fe3+/spermidine/putrescine transport system ATPase subunit